MKIMKHSQETSNASGLLLGIDLDGTLNVTNSFAMPNLTDDDDKSGKAAGRLLPALWRLGFNGMSFVTCSQCEIPGGDAQATQRGPRRR